MAINSEKAIKSFLSNKFLTFNDGQFTFPNIHSILTSLLNGLEGNYNNKLQTIFFSSSLPSLPNELTIDADLESSTVDSILKEKKIGLDGVLAIVWVITASLQNSENNNLANIASTINRQLLITSSRDSVAKDISALLLSIEDLITPSKKTQTSEITSFSKDQNLLSQADTLIDQLRPGQAFGQRQNIKTIYASRDRLITQATILAGFAGQAYAQQLGIPYNQLSPLAKARIKSLVTSQLKGLSDQEILELVGDHFKKFTFLDEYIFTVLNTDAQFMALLYAQREQIVNQLLEKQQNGELSGDEKSVLSHLSQFDNRISELKASNDLLVSYSDKGSIEQHKTLATQSQEQFEKYLATLSSEKDRTVAIKQRKYFQEQLIAFDNTPRVVNKDEYQRIENEVLQKVYRIDLNNPTTIQKFQFAFDTLILAKESPEAIYQINNFLISSILDLDYTLTRPEWELLKPILVDKFNLHLATAAQALGPKVLQQQSLESSTSDKEVSKRIESTHREIRNASASSGISPTQAVAAAANNEEKSHSPTKSRYQTVKSRYRLEFDSVEPELASTVIPISVLSASSLAEIPSTDVQEQELLKSANAVLVDQNAKQAIVPQNQSNKTKTTFQQTASKAIKEKKLFASKRDLATNKTAKVLGKVAGALFGKKAENFIENSAISLSIIKGIYGLLSTIAGTITTIGTALLGLGTTLIGFLPIGWVGAGIAATGLGLTALAGLVSNLNIFGGGTSQASTTSTATEAASGISTVPTATQAPTPVAITPITPTPLLTASTMTGTVLLGGFVVLTFLDEGEFTHQLDSRSAGNEFISLSKTATPNQLDNNQASQITYSIALYAEESSETGELYQIVIDTNSVTDEITYLGTEEDHSDVTTPIEQIREQLDMADGTLDRQLVLGEETVTISYPVDIDDTFEDTLISNTVRFDFTVLNEENNGVSIDQVSDTASLTIGDPDLACFEFTGPFTPEHQEMAVQAFLRRAGKSSEYLNLVCTVNGKEEPIVLNYTNRDPDYGAERTGPRSYDMHLDSFISLDAMEYTLVHESGHIIAEFHSEILNSFGSSVYGKEKASGLNPPDYNCYTYPLPARCMTEEAFSEAIALYVVAPTYPYFTTTWNGTVFPFMSAHPQTYNWVKNNIFGGVEVN